MKYFIQPPAKLDTISNVLSDLNNNSNNNASSYAVLQHGLNNVDHGVKLHHVHHHTHRHRH